MWSIIISFILILLYILLCISSISILLSSTNILILIEYRWLHNTSTFFIGISQCILFFHLLVHILLGSFKHIQILFSSKHVFLLCIINYFSVISFLTLYSNLFNSILISLTTSPITFSNDFCLTKVISITLSNPSLVDMTLLSYISFKWIIHTILCFPFFLKVLTLHILTTISIVSICCSSLISEILLRIITTGWIMCKHFMRNMILSLNYWFQWFTC